jgi:hypothetical protein
MPGDVWGFESADDTGEPLAERVVEALLARTLPSGGDLVDATAGAGTIARVARRHGVRSWSGDIAPRAPFVHRADARALLEARRPGIEPGCADVLVLHPPTFPHWCTSVPDDLGVPEGYRDELERMLAGSLAVVRPGGCAVMITRPVRERGRASLAVSHLEETLVLSGLVIEAYVLAVSVRAREDWHLLIGRVASGS